MASDWGRWEHTSVRSSFGRERSDFGGLMGVMGFGSVEGVGGPGMARVSAEDNPSVKTIAETH